MGLNMAQNCAMRATPANLFDQPANQYHHPVFLETSPFRHAERPICRKVLVPLVPMSSFPNHMETYRLKNSSSFTVPPCPCTGQRIQPPGAEWIQTHLKNGKFQQFLDQPPPAAGRSSHPVPV